MMISFVKPFVSLRHNGAEKYKTRCASHTFFFSIIWVLQLVLAEQIGCLTQSKRDTRRGRGVGERNRQVSDRKTSVLLASFSVPAKLEHSTSQLYSQDTEEDM